MSTFIRKYIAKLLREVADKIDSGNCELSESEAMDIMSAIGHQVMSKEDACLYLNTKTSNFGKLMREGKIPKGRKRRGFNELVWYKDELYKCTRKGSNFGNELKK